MAPRDVDPERGRRITELRKRRGYTSARALAEALGVHPRTVDNWSVGKAIDGPNLARLAELLKVTPGYLWTGEQDEPADPVSVIRARVDRLEGVLARHDGERAVALRAHDKRVEDELAAIRAQLATLAENQRNAALAMPGLVSEVRALRQAVDALRQPEASARPASEGS